MRETSMPVATTDHLWVEIQYMLVDVEINPEDGSMSVFASPEGQEAAEEGRTYCCWVCSTPANSDTVGTECPGAKDDEAKKG